MLPQPARIKLLVAKEAPIAVVLRRKPSRVFHILKWNTETDEIQPGSWFQGRIWDEYSDVSFDGSHMVYIAMGSGGQIWTGVCKPPYLHTIVDVKLSTTYHEGPGIFVSPGVLNWQFYHKGKSVRNQIQKSLPDIPFRIDITDPELARVAEPGLSLRDIRDGYHRIGPFPKWPKISFWSIWKRPAIRDPWRRLPDDPGCAVQPSPSHPLLRRRLLGLHDNLGYVYRWDLPDGPDVLDEHVSYAAYDAKGQLLVARLGVLYRYALPDLLRGVPTSVIDLEPIQRPEKARPNLESGPP